MTNEVTDRHPAQALRRCATTPEESLSASLPENEKMSASQTRYFIVTPIRKSAAMTNEVTDRHPAQALRRCATTPEESLSAPGEREDVRSADTILHSNPHSWERSDDAWGLWPPHCPCASEMRYYARGVTLCTRRARGCPQRGHAFS